MDPKIIKVSPETYKELLKLGAKGETFDDIIQRLIKEHKERRQQRGRDQRNASSSYSSSFAHFR